MRFLIAAATLFALALPLCAADKPCPEDCQRRAAAAFAFAKEKGGKPRAAIAPAPRAKSTCDAHCPCPDLLGSCECKPGACPCCAAKKPEAKKDTPVKPAPKVVAPVGGRLTINGVVHELGADGVYRPCQK